MKLADTYPIRLLCRLLSVPRSSVYYEARPALDEALLKTALPFVFPAARSQLPEGHERFSAAGRLLPACADPAYTRQRGQAVELSGGRPSWRSCKGAWRW
jgi:hypothetical protein